MLSNDKRKAIAKAVLKVYSEAIRTSSFEKDFPNGVAALRLSLQKLSKQLVASKLKWPEISRKLRVLAAGRQTRLKPAIEDAGFALHRAAYAGIIRKG